MSSILDLTQNTVLTTTEKNGVDRKSNPGMLLCAAKKHGIDWQHSIMIVDKDSDMQSGSKAGVAIRRGYLAYTESTLASNAKTHKIYLLRKITSLLTAPVAT